MEQQQTIPKDILDKANKLFPNLEQADEVAEYNGYIKGRIEERTAHIPARLTQEEIEKMLEILASSHGYKKPDTPDFDSHQTEEYDNNIFMKGCRAGYNAVIQYVVEQHPIQVDSRIAQYREWLTKMKGVAPGYVTAAQQFDIIFADTTGK